MKLLKLLFLFFLGQFFCVQFTMAQDFKLSLLAGVNFSQVNGDRLAGFDKFGIQGGAAVSRRFREKSALSFEIYYSEKGSKDVVNANNPIQDSTFRFNYIDIPILYNYYLQPKLKLQVGIYTGVRVKASFDDSYQEYDRSNQIRSLDYGITGGAEYQFSSHFSVNVRIAQSVLDINSYEKYYNLAIGTSVRYNL